MVPIEHAIISKTATDATSNLTDNRIAISFCHHVDILSSLRPFYHTSKKDDDLRVKPNHRGDGWML